MARKPPSPRRVQCYLCCHRFEVGVRAMTVSCPGCHKPLMVQDLVVKGLEAVKRLQTCGSLRIERRGRVIADLVQAHGPIEVEGTLHAKVVNGTRVYIRRTAHWKGDCHAATVTIEPGAHVESGCFCVPDETLGLDVPAPIAAAARRKREKA